MSSGQHDTTLYKVPFRWDGVVFVAASVFLGFVLDLPFWMSFPGIIIATLVAHALWTRFHKCPQCQGRLVARRVYLDDSEVKYRQFYDCSRCGAAWDAGEGAHYD